MRNVLRIFISHRAGLAIIFTAYQAAVRKAIGRCPFAEYMLSEAAIFAKGRVVIMSL